MSFFAVLLAGLAALAGTMEERPERPDREGEGLPRAVAAAGLMGGIAKDGCGHHADPLT